MSVTKKIRLFSQHFFSDFFLSEGHVNSTVRDQVVIYPQINLAYNRIKKAANSSALMYIADTLKENGHSKLKDKFLNSPLSREYKTESRDYCLSLSNINSPLMIKDIIENYYWLTIVRNPFTRLLSSYLEKGIRAQHGNIKYKQIPGLIRINKKGFGDFVTYLETGGLNKDKHWWPQTDLIYIPINRLHFIAKVENLNEDLKHVFERLGLNVSNKFFFSRPHPENFKGSHKMAETSIITNATKEVNNYYNKDLYKRVFKLYKKDFLEFGYSDN